MLLVVARYPACNPGFLMVARITGFALRLVGDTLVPGHSPQLTPLSMSDLEGSND